MRTRSVTFCSGTLTLEGRLTEPDGVLAGGVVLCHPHTLYAGSMSSALLPPLQRSLAAAGFLALRFNFRGAGRSEGVHEGGPGEIDDAGAALDLVASELPLAAPLISGGWSFGSVIALHAAIRHPKVVAAVAIAPPMGGGTTGLSPNPPTAEQMCAWARPVLVVGGEQDSICPVASFRGWAEASRAEVVVIPRADHYFREPQLVADAVVEFLRRHGVA